MQKKKNFFSREIKEKKYTDCALDFAFCTHMACWILTKTVRRLLFIPKATIYTNQNGGGKKNDCSRKGQKRRSHSLNMKLIKFQVISQLLC